MRAWLQLLRCPNLFTVPGDTLAGIAFAAYIQNGSLPTLPVMILAGTSALSLYCFGLLLNDVHDYRDDCRIHPERPLPAHKVSFLAASTGLILTLCAGLTLAAAGSGTLLNGLVLTGLILTYNVVLKRYLLPSCIAMGLCRGASFLLGIPVSSWWSPEIWPVSAIAIGLSIYVAAVTRIAKQEDAPAKHGRYVWLPFLTMLCLGILLWAMTKRLPENHLRILTAASFLILFLGLIGALYSSLKLQSGPVPADTTRREIGRLIRNLIFYQAAILMLFPETVIPALFLLLGWPLSQLISRYIYSS